MNPLENENQDKMVVETAKQALISVNLLVGKLADEGRTKDIFLLEKILDALSKQIVLLEPFNDGL